MKTMMFIFAMLISVVCFGQEVPAPVSSVDKFVAEYYWIIGGLIVIVEYLVGASKLKANSMIDMVIGFFKMFSPSK
tara:strand:- start:53 stop:280 length:228 start_codon:yes stop_codon:yes gene_type:complete